MLLGIDTSTRYAGVCLRDEGRVLASLSWHSSHNHTRELLPAIQQVMGQAKVETRGLSVIAVAMGPGGFSALRVGMSVAKGLAYPLDIPMVGVGTLEMEAYPYASTGLRICPLLDVGRDEVAAALFQLANGEWRKGVDESIQTPEALVDSLKRRGYDRVLFCGEGVQGKESFLREALGESVLVIVPPVPVARLWALAELGWQRYAAGQVDDVATIQPFYLRRPSIGQPRVPRPVTR